MAFGRYLVLCFHVCQFSDLAVYIGFKTALLVRLSPGTFFFDAWVLYTSSAAPLFLDCHFAALFATSRDGEPLFSLRPVTSTEEHKKHIPQFWFGLWSWLCVWAG